MAKDISAFAVIAEELETWCPDLKGAEQDDTYRAAMTLLMATWVTGPDVDRIVDLTHYPRSFVSLVCARMLKSGLWEECGTIHSDHWDRDDHCRVVAFLMDVMVGQGLAIAKKERDEDFRYWAKEFASSEFSRVM